MLSTVWYLCLILSLEYAKGFVGVIISFVKQVCTFSETLQETHFPEQGGLRID